MKNMQMIIDSGLDPIVSTTITSSYVSGLYFSLSAARQTVPHLQQIFQADAAHMSFGKYTLYSCYGRNANGNTSCVGMGISFGNETKDDWDQFLQCRPKKDKRVKSAIEGNQKKRKKSIADNMEDQLKKKAK